MSWYCTPHRKPDRPTRKIAICSFCGIKSKEYTGPFQCQQCGRADTNPVVVSSVSFDDGAAERAWQRKNAHYVAWQAERDRAVAKHEPLDSVKITCSQCGAQLLYRNKKRHSLKCKVQQSPPSGLRLG
jgi:predicted RNA-binding Zn-ribbon protein involved in translation (DUF1610 family)